MLLGNLFVMASCFGDVPPGGGPEEEPRNTGGTLHLGWPAMLFGVLLDKLEEVTKAREVWTSLLRRFPHDTSPDKQ